MIAPRPAFVQRPRPDRRRSEWSPALRQHRQPKQRVARLGAVPPASSVGRVTTGNTRPERWPRATPRLRPWLNRDPAPRASGKNHARRPTVLPRALPRSRLQSHSTGHDRAGSAGGAPNHWEGAMTEQVGFIGLGIMGRPMARNLVKAGFSLVVHSRSRGPVDELVAEATGTAARSRRRPARATWRRRRRR